MRNFVKGFHNGLRRILWRGKNFQHSQSAAVHPHTISEGSSGIDGNTQSFGWARHEEGRVHQKRAGEARKGTSSTRVTEAA
jgi:hypothetical protein